MEHGLFLKKFFFVKTAYLCRANPYWWVCAKLSFLKFASLVCRTADSIHAYLNVRGVKTRLLKRNQATI